MSNKPIYRMSSAGYCPRRLGAIRLGMEATPYQNGLINQQKKATGTKNVLKMN